MKFSKSYSIIITLVALVSTVAFVTLFFRENYDNKILVKLGLKEQTVETNWAVFSWDSCIQKLNYDADVVFFGDSITRGGNFQEYFKEIKTVNLGYSGDNIDGMLQRISTVKAVAPEKIFILVGINGLRDNNVNKCIEKYDILLTELKKEIPKAEIFVQSVLPISKESEKTICSNSSIKAFNKGIEEITLKHQLTYIDLFSLYVKDGELNPQFSDDGVHITADAYSVWYKAIEKYIR